jgi:ech hydrogenase subunit B
MSADSFLLSGIIAACVLAPLLVVGTAEAVIHHFNAKKQGNPVISLLHIFKKRVANFRSAQNADSTWQTLQILCGLVSVVFQLTALVMLGLQRDLVPIFFLYSFAVLIGIVGRRLRISPVQGLDGNDELQKFVVMQSLLLLIVIGIFFATGSFKASAIKEYPRLLVVDLPLLCLALVIVAQTYWRRTHDISTIDHRALMLMNLADCYRNTTLLLLIGFFFSHSLSSAAIIALLVYLLPRFSVQLYSLLPERLLANWSWGYVFFGCGLNIAWIYIKFWT